MRLRSNVCAWGIVVAVAIGWVGLVAGQAAAQDSPPAQPDPAPAPGTTPPAQPPADPASGAPAAAQPSPEALALDREMSRAYRAGEYEKAITAGEALLKLRPDDPAVCYNLGCMHSLLGRKEEALRWLRKATEHGFGNLEAITWDKDLATLKGDPAFVEVLGLAEKNAAKGLQAIRDRIAKTNPLMVVPPTLVTSNRVPLMVALHGYGQREENVVDAVREAAAASGVIVVAPRAPQPLRAGFAWTGNIETHMIVEDAIERAAAVYNIDRDRIILFGFSQGGHNALTMAMRYPGQFHGLIAVGARYAPEVLGSIDRKPPRMPRYYLMVGANDPVLEETRKAAADLKAMHAPVHLEVYPDIGHAYPTRRDEELIKAIDFALGR